jgi:hypothetical protein
MAVFLTTVAAASADRLPYHAYGQMAYRQPPDATSVLTWLTAGSPQA